MAGKLNLFDDNSDEEEDLSLTINKDYAQRYEEWREAEIKRQLEDRYGNADESLSSSSSEDEDDPEELKRVLNKDFFEVMASLKTKDPKIYNPEVEFFKTEKSQSGFDPAVKIQKKKEKPVYLRDYERKLIVERGGQLSDDESGNEEIVERAHSPTYVEEQQKLKDSFKKVLQDDNSDDEGDLLKKKTKTQEEKAKEEEDFIEWLKGEREALPDKETETALKPLQNLWNNPNLDDGEKFLKDYILNKRYLEHDDAPLDDKTLLEDDYQEEYMNQFERKYNFRFEEPDKEFIKRYPRTMEQSLRKKDTRRKEKREAVKKRKEEEKQKKREELKLLKALKRKEILQKIEKIKSITGNDELGLEPEELEEDFDPEAHDRKMRELFNDQYYEGADDAEGEDGLNLPPLEEELLDDDIIDWDQWDGTDREMGAALEEETGRDDEGPSCEDPGFNMDCDYDPSSSLGRKEKAGRQSAREKRKLKRQSRFGRLVRREKPVFDPSDKTFEQYVDEYYGMDYEDLIGDLPCRFKYKKVPANSFGLTIEEILAADDKELNQWASIKKAYTIRPEHVERNEAKIYELKAQNEELKRRILPSLFKNEYNISEKETKKKRRKKKKSKTFEEDADEQTSSEQATDPHGSLEMSKGSVSVSQSETVVTRKEEKKKRKKKRATENVENDESNSTINESAIPKSGKNGKKFKKEEGNQDSLKSSKETAQGNRKDNEIRSKALKNSKKRKYQESDQDRNHEVSKKVRKCPNKDWTKKKFNSQGQENFEKEKDQKEITLSDARLKAYGIHPKRFRNKLKYGPKK